MKAINPKVSLIGAGPGAADLITVRALKKLQTADVVLYDALVNPDLLKEVPPHAEKIFVGKRAGVKCIKQDAINFLIVQSALQYGHCVRLKGGDPFVFGRGHEELEYAQSFNIPVEVVPGLSSALTLPHLQHVPLTRRGESESFWVLTGSTKNHQLSKDIIKATKTNATLVILMGIRKLPVIAEILMSNGSEDIPIMIIESGSTEAEKIVLGTANNIVAKANENKISTPGIIVIGKVVALHPEFKNINVLKHVA